MGWNDAGSNCRRRWLFRQFGPSPVRGWDRSPAGKVRCLVSEDLNHDPLVQRLTQLTPSATTIDRDALLFAAGRASAPRTLGWKMLAAALAISQTATLSGWFL